MSRIRQLAHSLSSGYIQIFANTVFTLVSVPLALHYLPTKEFGLWALVTQVVGYLMLVELGMTPAMVRVMIDHKDRPNDGTYGSVVKTGALVLVVQGGLVALLSWALGFWLPGLMNVPAEYSHPFRLLILGYGLLTGLLFPQRMLIVILSAHQRYDVVNYATTVSFAVNLPVLWIGFQLGWNAYSLLIAHAVGTLSSTLVQLVMTHRLHLMPRRGNWGRIDGRVFREIFFFGSDLFLISLGLQLLGASQVVIITRVLGLEAAAVWSIATKVFTLAQQFVWRLWDFSAGAISEMIVRGERERLRLRFQDIFTITASVSVLVGIGVAACNESLLATWTRGRISWSGMNDLLMAILFVTTSITRMHIGLTTATKKIHATRYVYFLEGTFFVGAALLLAHRWGITGMICAAILMNVLWTGIYGTWRTAEEFQTALRDVAFAWTKPALRLAFALTPVAVLCWWLLHSLPALIRLGLSAVVVGGAGAFFFWKLGLTPALREEFHRTAVKVRRRLKSTSREPEPT